MFVNNTTHDIVHLDAHVLVGARKNISICVLQDKTRVSMAHFSKHLEWLLLRHLWLNIEDASFFMDQVP